MKREDHTPRRFDSLTQLHRELRLPGPLHPLISLIDITDPHMDLSRLPGPVVYNFYKISFKKNLTGTFKYGQGHYDFDEGGLFFKAPNQVTAEGKNNGDHTGFTLAFHPDYLSNYPLATRIRQYGFFSYSVNEALHLSNQEKEIIIGIFKNIQQELQSRIDDFSHEVVISHIETLLNYSNRFYKRQFITRKAVNSDLLEKLEQLLDEYFNSERPSSEGIPTVQFLADHLNLSPGYLSDMLRSLTGQSAQQHIHHKLIEKAKEKISTTSLSISEIAFQLGFEHASSFNKLFKAKTKLSPLEFRTSFN